MTTTIVGSGLPGVMEPDGEWLFCPNMRRDDWRMSRPLNWPAECPKLRVMQPKLPARLHGKDPYDRYGTWVEGWNAAARAYTAAIQAAGGEVVIT